jgi:group II intron reverse transcriptase/maturase
MDPREGNASAPQTAEVASTGLERVAELAKQNPNLRFRSLAHYITVGALFWALSRLREGAAVGVDEVSVAEYASEERVHLNLEQLHRRLRAGRYRHQPIRRVHIPKGPGKTRPIGVSCTEDKVVQMAIRDVLEVIYEQDFRDCSYGFRPRRGAHDALRAVDRMVMRGGVTWILEADIQSFFDSLTRSELMKMIGLRVADGQLLRLIGKCLHVGVLDGAEYLEPTSGTVQGSVLSPLLGNIYLHHVLDVWFEDVVRPRLQGPAYLVRYADDFIIGFTCGEDAKRVAAVLPKRMEKFGLRLHPDKTRLVPFTRPSLGQRHARQSETLDFLGFTLFWRRTRRTGWVLGMKTRKARIRKAVQAIHEFCRSRRREAVEDQRKGLWSRLMGHYAYFGVNGNYRCLERMYEAAVVAWHKWLNRRSQRSRLNWKRFADLLEAHPLPAPRIMVTLWGGAP